MNLKTGFKELDDVIGGLNEKDLIVMASRPGVGKTTLAINMANNLSKQTTDKILYFTLETSKDRLKESFASDNIEIIDNSKITVEEINSKCEEIAKNSLSLVIIDYIQLVSTTSKIDKVKDNDYIYSELKELAVNLNIPIIVLSQLTRTIEEREDKRPTLEDLNIQEADKIIFLYRENYYNKNNNLTDTEIIVAKNSNDSTGMVRLINKKIAVNE